MLDAHGGKNKASDHLGLELQVNVSCLVDVGNQTQVLLSTEQTLQALYRFYLLNLSL